MFQLYVKTIFRVMLECYVKMLLPEIFLKLKNKKKNEKILSVLLFFMKNYFHNSLCKTLRSTHHIFTEHMKKHSLNLQTKINNFQKVLFEAAKQLWLKQCKKRSMPHQTVGKIRTEKSLLITIVPPNNKKNEKFYVQVAAGDIIIRLQTKFSTIDMKALHLGLKDATELNNKKIPYTHNDSDFVKGFILRRITATTNVTPTYHTLTRRHIAALRGLSKNNFIITPSDKDEIVVV